jgi:hypothetical protein
MTAPVWTRSWTIKNWPLELFLPQQQGADGKDRPAGKKQHNLCCLYDAGKESVHHTHLRKLALRQALATDLATGRAQLTSIRLISNSAAPEANARSKTPVRDAFKFSFYWALQLST